MYRVAVDEHTYNVLLEISNDLADQRNVHTKRGVALAEVVRILCEDHDNGTASERVLAKERDKEQEEQQRIQDAKDEYEREFYRKHGYTREEWSAAGKDQ